MAFSISSVKLRAGNRYQKSPLINIKYLLRPVSLQTSEFLKDTRKWSYSCVISVGYSRFNFRLWRLQFFIISDKRLLLEKLWHHLLHPKRDTKYSYKCVAFSPIISLLRAVYFWSYFVPRLLVLFTAVQYFDREDWNKFGTREWTSRDTAFNWIFTVTYHYRRLKIIYDPIHSSAGFKSASRFTTFLSWQLPFNFPYSSYAQGPWINA